MTKVFVRTIVCTPVGQVMYFIQKIHQFRMLGLFFIVWNSLSCTAEYNSQSWSLTFWSKHHFESTLLFCGSFFWWQILVRSSCTTNVNGDWPTFKPSIGLYLLHFWSDIVSSALTPYSLWAFGWMLNGW